MQHTNEIRAKIFDEIRLECRTQDHKMFEEFRNDLFSLIACAMDDKYGKPAVPKIL